MQHREESRSRIELPAELRKAQEAINLPEVQDIIKRLATYNLGVCMPHIHDERAGGFKALPEDMVQVESDLRVTFVTRSKAERTTAVPVAWQWSGDGVTSGAICISQCEVSTTPDGSERHVRLHNRG